MVHDDMGVFHRVPVKNDLCLIKVNGTDAENWE